MNQPVMHWPPPSFADAIGVEYGYFLEHMPKSEKLFLINLLSGVLHEVETNPLEEFTILEYLAAQNLGQAVGAAFQETLAHLNQYDVSTIETVMALLAIAIAAQ